MSKKYAQLQMENMPTYSPGDYEDFSDNYILENIDDFYNISLQLIFFDIDSVGASELEEIMDFLRNSNDFSLDFFGDFDNINMHIDEMALIKGIYPEISNRDLQSILKSNEGDILDPISSENTVYIIKINEITDYRDTKENQLLIEEAYEIWKESQYLNQIYTELLEGKEIEKNPTPWDEIHLINRD